MHPNINVRWEAGVGTWIFNCAQARAVLISTTHLIAVSQAAHEFQTSCKHASPGAWLCSMFSGSTWWNREKTAQSLGFSICIRYSSLSGGFPMAQVCSRGVGHQRPCLWAGSNTVQGSSLPVSFFTLLNRKPKLLHCRVFS